MKKNRWSWLFNIVLVICCLLLFNIISGCTNDDDDDDNDNDNDDNNWVEDIVIQPGSRGEVWYEYLTGDDPLNYNKYGVYSNRLMAVVHPEVYLRGDSLFLNNVEGLELQPMYANPDTFFFYLDDIDFSRYEIISTEDFYPPEMSLFPYLDRRCLAAKSTVLVADIYSFPEQQTRIKEIEKGILYFCKIRQHNPEAEVFLLYSDNERCFVWDSGTLYSMTDDTVIDSTRLTSENIILIFNDTHVWYPLMERDDTNDNHTLSSLVQQFGGNQLPQLTMIEEYFLSYLRNLSKLNNEREILLAGLLAGKCNYSYGVFKMDAGWIDGMDSIWQSVMPDMKHPDLVSMLGWYTYGSIDASLTKQIILDSNVLSPYTYYLASYVPVDFQFEDFDLLTWMYFYLGFYWGTVWELGFDTYNIDESLLCVGGACDIQAMNIASVLNLKGINNYLYIGYRGIMQYAHTLVYVPEFGSLFSNAMHYYIGSIFTGYDFPNAPFFLHHNGEWATYILESYYGSVAPAEVANWLEFLHSQYQDTIYMNSRQDGESIDVEYSDSLAALRSDSYNNNAVIMTLP